MSRVYSVSTTDVGNDFVVRQSGWPHLNRHITITRLNNCNLLTSHVYFHSNNNASRLPVPVTWVGVSVGAMWNDRPKRALENDLDLSCQIDRLSALAARWTNKQNHCSATFSEWNSCVSQQIWIDETINGPLRLLNWVNKCQFKCYFCSNGPKHYYTQSDRVFHFLFVLQCGSGFCTGNGWKLINRFSTRKRSPYNRSRLSVKWMHFGYSCA